MKIPTLPSDWCALQLCGRARGIRVPLLTELDGEGGSAGHRTLVALARQAGGHLGDQEDGHGHLGLGELCADQVQEAIFAGEVNGVILLSHDKVAVQVIASVLQHGALGRAVELGVIDPKPCHHHLPHLLPGLDNSPGPVSLAIESDELTNRGRTRALAVQGRSWNWSNEDIEF